MTLYKHAVLLLFLFCSVTVAANSTIFATIDSLSGTVEIQRAKTQTWLPSRIGDKLYNNDMVRARSVSFLRIGWPDGSTSFLHENSQILLALYEDESSDIISRHITVISGAVFFVIKEVLPKSLTKKFDTKVFTPTGVVCVRGTAFCVSVDSASGDGTVKLINGTVEFKTINTNASKYVSAGFKSTISKNEDPTGPSAMLNSEIDTLRHWVPAWVMDMEMAAQLKKASRDRDLISGSSDDKLLVMPFVNSSKYPGRVHIRTVLADMIADQLRSGNIQIDLGDTLGTDALAQGEKAGARYLVTGDIQKFNIIQHAEISARADEYKEFYIAIVGLSIQLTNVSLKKTMMDTVFSSEVRGMNVKDNSWKSVERLPFSLDDKQFSKSLLGQALRQVIEQAGSKINKIVKYE